MNLISASKNIDKYIYKIDVMNNIVSGGSDWKKEANVIDKCLKIIETNQIYNALFSNPTTSLMITVIPFSL